MGFLDKAKAAATQAAVKAKQSADDLQTKVDLGSAYDELGRAAFELIESGEVAHPKLDEPAAKVRALRQKAAKGDGPEPPEAEPETLESAPADEAPQG